MFKNRRRGQKIILISNLTYLDESLVKGTIGYTVGKYGFWSRFSQNFIGARFPVNIKVDAFFRDIEFIEEETNDQ